MNIMFDSMICEFSSFASDELDKDLIALSSVKIVSFSGAKMSNSKTKDCKKLLSQLLDFAENQSYSSVSMKIDINNVKTFENPGLYQIKKLGVFKSLDYGRFMIKDIYCTSMPTADFGQTLLKLKPAKALDMVVMKVGYSHISPNQTIIDTLISLKIRKLSLIKISVCNYTEYMSFLNHLKTIKTLAEIEYSYEKHSYYEENLVYYFDGVKTSNFTGTKRRRKMFI